ncbi:MAG: amidohydrolase family protein [Longimicrobiales bacterium]
MSAFAGSAFGVTRCGLAAFAVVAVTASAAAPQVPVGESGTFVIRGGTIVVGNGERIENGSVVIEDGRITAAGANVQAPAGAREVDAAGRFVYPGMMDARTPIGLREIGQVNPMNLDSELGDYNPHNRAVVALNVESTMIGVTRANGITHVISAPSGGVISGQAALINLSGWTWEDMAVNSAAAYVINYPRSGGGRGFGGGRGRGGSGAEERVAEQVRALEDRLRTAKQHEAARAAGSERFDLQYEAMRPLVRGEVPALVSADTKEQIEAVVALQDTFGIRVIIQGGDEAWKVAELLASKNVPVVLGSIQSTPASDAPYDAIYAQPGVLVRAGVKIAFSTGSAANARHVPYHVALAVGYGLDPDDAIRALTIWPAEIFGVADQLGTIEAGKIANLFVASGDPLDVRTEVREVFVAGRLVPQDDRARLLYEKYRARPAGY